MNINYKQQLTQQMVGEYLILFENYTRKLHMKAKPIRALELHYPMIFFSIKENFQ